MPDFTIENHRMCLSSESWECTINSSTGSGSTYVVRFGRLDPSAQRARHCTYDFTCTCPHFQTRLRLQASGYCKHVNVVRHDHCGWSSHDGGGLDESPLTPEEAGAAEAAGRCPSCGGETTVVRVAV